MLLDEIARELPELRMVIAHMGYPWTNGTEELYGIAHMMRQTNLPTIPREQLRGIVERDALGLLGITPLAATPSVARAGESTIANNGSD